MICSPIYWHKFTIKNKTHEANKAQVLQYKEERNVSIALFTFSFESLLIVMASGKFVYRKKNRQENLSTETNFVEKICRQKKFLSRNFVDRNFFQRSIF